MRAKRSKQGSQGKRHPRFSTLSHPKKVVPRARRCTVRTHACRADRHGTSRKNSVFASNSEVRLTMPAADAQIIFPTLAADKEPRRCCKSFPRSCNENAPHECFLPYGGSC